MSSFDEWQQEVAFLADRIRQLRALRESQKHLLFISAHLQEHIERLEARMDELTRQCRAS